MITSIPHGGTSKENLKKTQQISKTNNYNWIIVLYSIYNAYNFIFFSMLRATCASIKVYSFFFIVCGYIKKAFKRKNCVNGWSIIWFKSIQD